MKCCISALDGPYQKQVRENLKFYARKLPGHATKLHFPVPEGFYSSSLSVTNSGLGNVRCVDLSLIHISEPTRPY